jgi:hypothetical protein
VLKIERFVKLFVSEQNFEICQKTPLQANSQGRESNLRFRNHAEVLLNVSAMRRAIALFLTASANIPLHAQKLASTPEKIEWTWEVRPPNLDLRLPNVLLLGDSITRNYFPQVTRDLAGIANVYLMASSTSIGDPRLPHQIAEFASMEKAQFRAVHFNNGMHGWGYSESRYKSAFPQFLRSVRKLVGEKGSLDLGQHHIGSARRLRWSDEFTR